MIKKSQIFIFILLIMPFVSAMTIDMKQEYSQGETIIAKISGSFIDPILEENVFFYRSSVRVPMDYDVIKIGNSYYIKVSLIGKSENNYSMQIKNLRYYDSGLLSTKTVIKNFTITNSTADFAIDPGFVSSSNNFYIKLQNLKNSALNVNIKGFTGISHQNSVNLGPSETYFLNFQINSLTASTLGFIEINSEKLKYSIPAYLIYVPIPPPPEQPFCGDSKITSGETCDGDNFGYIKNCSNFGFNNGTLSCNPPGSQSQCLIDTSNCFNTPTSPTQPLPPIPPIPPLPPSPTGCSSTNPCPKDYFCLNSVCIQNITQIEEPFCGDGNINAGESCDGTNWGAMENCKNLGFDGGTLRCTNCDFNTSACFNDVVAEDTGCVYDRECPTDKICEDAKCISEECDINRECDKNQKCEYNRCIDNECAVDKDCKNENLTCKDGACVKKECTIDYNCAYGYKCDNGKCMKKGCMISYNCAYGMVCDDFVCKIRIKNECTDTKNCTKDQVCVRGNCLNQSKVTGDPKDIQGCLEMGGKTCKDGTKCDGQTQKISEVVCCFANCVENTNSTGKIIGWGLLATIFVIILWFFLRGRKRTRY